MTAQDKVLTNLVDLMRFPTQVTFLVDSLKVQPRQDYPATR
jgi:hypothetical protein